VTGICPPFGGSAVRVRVYLVGMKCAVRVSGSVILIVTGLSVYSSEPVEVVHFWKAKHSKAVAVNWTSLLQLYLPGVVAVPLPSGETTVFTLKLSRMKFALIAVSRSIVMVMVGLVGSVGHSVPFGRVQFRKE